MPGSGSEDRLRAAQVFVVVALVCMVVGAVSILLARDVSVVDLSAGEEATLLTYEAPGWDPWGRVIRIEGFGIFTVAPEPEGVANETVIHIRETTTGRVIEDPSNETLRPGDPIWSGTAEPGSRWVVTVTNHGEALSRVSAEVYCRSCYAVGGALVGIGVMGFVAYRLGIRHS